MKSPRVLNRRPLNIAVLAGHTPYEILLSETGHNFYSIGGDNVLKWNDLHGVKPYNYTECNESVFRWIDFDLMITHNPLGHAHIWTKYLHKMPVVCIWHTSKPTNFNTNMWGTYPLNQCKHVFITEYNQIDWGKPDSIVIYHTIDDRFNPLEKSDNIITVVNDWNSRRYEYGWDLYWYIRNNHNANYEIYGDNPGISPALSRDELATKLGKSGIYLSTAMASPISCAVLESAMCGAALVLTSTNATPDIFKHGESAFLFSPHHPEDAIKYLKLLEDIELRNRMGNAAREVALKMTKEKFLNLWNETLYAT